MRSFFCEVFFARFFLRFLSDLQKFNFAIDIANGMNWMHKRNKPLIHRDLKNDNVYASLFLLIKLTFLIKLMENATVNTKVWTLLYDTLYSSSMLQFFFNSIDGTVRYGYKCSMEAFVICSFCYSTACRR